MNRTPLPARAFDAVLFDMDGTILSSIACAERVWAEWARRHGVDVARFLPTIHGKRAAETIASLGRPDLDVEAEAAWVLEAEMIDVGGIEPIAGAPAMLSALPPGRWGVVTSASRALALRRLAAAGLSEPPMMVSAEDVVLGKPAPEGFLLGAARLGADIADCLVFEDAPAGIAAAEAAGAALVVITATHAHPAATPHPCIRDYDAVSMAVDAAGRIAFAAR
ncbi:MAG: HAD-IA family hydrolase [Burkholderiaceae bacterium]